MNLIFLNILIGVILLPALLGITAVWLNGYREQKGLVQLPPDKLSLILMLLILVSWSIAGFNIMVQILK